MKINAIKRSINYDVLNEAIADYTNIFNEPYLIMSCITRDILMENLSFTYCPEVKTNLAYYRGYKVLIDNELPEGVIDIR